MLLIFILNIFINYKINKIFIISCIDYLIKNLPCEIKLINNYYL